MASSATQSRYGRLYAMSTCLRSQERDSMHMTVSSPSGNNPTSPCSPSVLESTHPCKQSRIFVPHHLHWRKWTMNYILWLSFYLYLMNTGPFRSPSCYSMIWTRPRSGKRFQQRKQILKGGVILPMILPLIPIIHSNDHWFRQWFHHSFQSQWFQWFIPMAIDFANDSNYLLILPMILPFIPFIHSNCHWFQSLGLFTVAILGSFSVHFQTHFQLIFVYLAEEQTKGD